MANYPAYVISTALQQTTPVSYFDDKEFQVLNAAMMHWARRWIEITKKLDAGIDTPKYNAIILAMVKRNYFATSNRVKEVMARYEAR